jgi:hypothetical protein
MYLIHGAFFNHALTPASVYVIDPKTHLHLLSGQIGNIEAVFHWDGLASTILMSVLVFIIGWAAVSGLAKLFAQSGLQSSHDKIDPNQLAHSIVANDVVAVATGAHT